MATVPLIGSVFVSNLVTVSDYAGIFLTTVLFFIPACLHFVSKWKSVKTFGPRTLTEEVDAESRDLIHNRPESVQDEEKQDIGLLHSSNGTTAVGSVESCYKPTVGRDFVAVGSLVFGVVAIVATVMSWFSSH